MPDDVKWSDADETWAMQVRRDSTSPRGIAWEFEVAIAERERCIGIVREAKYLLDEDDYEILDEIIRRIADGRQGGER